MNRMDKHCRNSIFYIDSYYKIPMVDSKIEYRMMRTDPEYFLNSFVDIFTQHRDKPFPMRYPLSDVKDGFTKLMRAKHRWLQGDVVMKQKDYGFNIGKQLGVTQLGNKYNGVSGHFNFIERMKCGGYNRVSPWAIWNGEGMKKAEWQEKVRGFLSPLFRGVNIRELISIKEYRFCFRLSSTVYTAPQFKVHVATQIIRKFSSSGRVLDFSMGWGDRLAGFYTHPNPQFYIGTDPNNAMHKIYQQQCQYYSGLRKISPIVLCDGQPAEDVAWGEYPKVDLIFTSPPYFYTELYAKGQKYQNKQSWFRYKTYEDWFMNFLATTLEKTTERLDKGGFVAINIMDFDIEGKRYQVCKDMYQWMQKLKLKYEGYVGMRMKQRPKNHAEEDYMSSMYVEPIWIFRK